VCHAKGIEVRAFLARMCLLLQKNRTKISVMKQV
jgi:hypothetical protein